MRIYVVATGLTGGYAVTTTDLEGSLPTLDPSWPDAQTTASLLNFLIQSDFARFGYALKTIDEDHGDAREMRRRLAALTATLPIAPGHLPFYSFSPDGAYIVRFLAADAEGVYEHIRATLATA